MKPQCDHREPPAARAGMVTTRAVGRRCTKRAYYHASNISSEGGGNFCQPHGLDRSKPGVKLERIQALGRCACHGGDIPHRGAEEHRPINRTQPARYHSRCTRSASVQIQRVVSTEGKLIPKSERSPRSYCALCAAAIERYQLGEVERAS